MIAITFDVDWAPDKIVADVVSLLDEKQVPATLFCTNYTKDHSGNSSNLSALLHKRHEVALHPDFQNTSSYAEQWQQLLALYPQARGWRSHNGMTGWPIIKEGVARGMRYEVFSSVFDGYVTPSHVNGAMKDYVAFTTAFWDSHRFHDRSFSWSLRDMPLQQYYLDPDKIIVLGFHPNIVYYDMSYTDEYDARKSSYHEVREEDSYRHRPRRGAMKLLEELLGSVPAANFSTVSSFAIRAGHWLA